MANHIHLAYTIHYRDSGRPAPSMYFKESLTEQGMGMLDEGIFIIPGSCWVFWH